MGSFPITASEWKQAALNSADLAQQYLAEKESEVAKIEDKVLDIIAEFSDQPETCLGIIADYLERRQFSRGRAAVGGGTHEGK